MEQNENMTVPGVEKLTDWEKEPDVRDLKQDLENARPAHQSRMQDIQRWSDLMAVRGSAKPTKVKGRSSVQPKLIRRQAEWRYSALTEPFLGSNKLFKVDPVTFEDAEAARQNSLVLNWQFRTKLNRVNFVDNFVRATVDEGTSITRVGWKRQTIMVDQEVPVYDFFPLQTEEQLTAFQTALDQQAADPRGYEEDVPDEIKAAIELYNESG